MPLELASDPLEQVFSHTWQEFHLSREHTAQLMLYAESYGSLPIEQVPWETIVILTEMVSDHITQRDAFLDEIQQAKEEPNG